MIDPLTQQEQLQMGMIAFQCSESGMALLSQDGIIRLANAAFHQVLGYENGQLAGEPLHTLLHPRMHAKDISRLESAEEIHFLHLEGYPVHAHAALKLLEPSTASNCAFLLELKKTTPFRSLQHASGETAVSLPSLEEALDKIPDGFICIDSYSRFTYMNKAAEQMMKCNRDKLIGRSVWYSFPEAVGTPLYDHYLSCTTTQISSKQELYYAPSNRWFEVHSYPRDNMYSAFFRDITQAKHTEQTLQESESMYRMLADNSTDMIARIALDGMFLYISPASKTLLGYEPEELIGHRVYEFFHPEEFMVQLYQEKMQLSDLHLNLNAYRFRKKDGTYIWFESTARYILNDQGLQTEIISISRDISARKHVERQLLETNELLQKISTVDALTGVANRRGFDECFQREWKQGVRDATALSMILVDIDNFKRYNDSHGHAQGDLCLKKVAVALSQAAERPGDFIARYGGEEFVLLLPATDTRGAYKVAEKLRKAVESLRIVHNRSETTLVTVSLGTATMTPSRDMDPEELFIRADKALYQAKQDGRNLSRIYQCEA
ncbi:diguanylate cyclase [Paenibacillus rigui]|uniref:Diguanylate cyclase n=1 Tax=Paenibacillus rigui TaxID=554312 RepID=A0A229UL97_9BACL|nr:diguanylate cyclase [Paenibacillus rigui]OXM84153.1 hypothetical protein CF651_22210 [Paenibacillus rigui]